MKRLLITGASGFVGGELLKKIPSDWQTVCLGRNRVLECSRWIECDLSSPADVKSVAEELRAHSFDSIIHLAAHVPKTVASDGLDSAVTGNLHATVNILQILGEYAPKIIIGSTAEVYDQAQITGMITEECVVGPSSYYGATKLGSEFIAQAYAKKHAKMN